MISIEFGPHRGHGLHQCSRPHHIPVDSPQRERRGTKERFVFLIWVDYHRAAVSPHRGLSRVQKRSYQ